MDTTTIAAITLEPKPLKRALSLLQPILGGAQLSPPSLTLRAFAGAPALHAVNTEMEARILCGAPTAEAPPVPVALPPRTFHAMLSSATGEVTISRADDITTHISADGAEADLILQTLADHPAIAAPGATRQAGHIHATPLRRAIDLVRHAVSTEETRYYLNGIYIHPDPAEPTTIAIIATDGHRLVRHAIPGITHNLEQGYILPRAAVRLLHGALKLWPDEDVFLAVTHTGVISFTTANFEIVTKTIDGTFPDYTRVIPNYGAHSPAAIIDAGALRRFATRCQALNGARTGNAIQIICDQARTGNVDCQWTSADNGTLFQHNLGTAAANFTIGFQPRYILQALDALNTPHVQLFAPDSASPAILTGAPELADPQTTYVIMPVRL